MLVYIRFVPLAICDYDLQIVLAPVGALMAPALIGIHVFSLCTFYMFTLSCEFQFCLLFYLCCLGAFAPRHIVITITDCFGTGWGPYGAGLDWLLCIFLLDLICAYDIM